MGDRIAGNCNRVPQEAPAADPARGGGVRRGAGAWALALLGGAAVATGAAAVAGRLLPSVLVRLPRVLCRPRPAGGEDLAPVAFRSLDGVPLCGWLALPASGGAARARGVGILCHGYLNDHRELLPVARFLQREGYACLLFDFRATGHSGGDRCTFGFREVLDVLGALRYLAERPEFARLPRFGVGTSMGAVALALAAPLAPELVALVLDCMYPDLLQALRRRCRLALGPLAPLAERAARPTLAREVGADPAEVSPAAALALRPELPTLLTFGGWDVYVPRRVASALAGAVPPPKEVWHAPATPHSRLHRWRAREFERRVSEFLARALAPCVTQI